MPERWLLWVAGFTAGYVIAVVAMTCRAVWSARETRKIAAAMREAREERCRYDEAEARHDDNEPGRGSA